MARKSKQRHDIVGLILNIFLLCSLSRIENIFASTGNRSSRTKVTTSQGGVSRFYTSSPLFIKKDQRQRKDGVCLTVVLRLYKAFEDEEILHYEREED